MNKNTRLHIACRVYVEVVSSPCNTAAYIFTVTLEVHKEHRLAGFCVAHFSHTLIHICSLVGSGNKLRGSIVTYGHIVEVKTELAAEVNHFVEEFVACNLFDILTCVAD